MIKLKKILKEGVHGKFWWMNPQGKLYRVMKIDADTGHREAAIEFLMAMGVTPLPDVFQQMYQYGWIRVAYLGHQGLYSIEINSGYDNEPNLRQLGTLKDLATELKAYEIVSKSSGKVYRV